MIGELIDGSEPVVAAVVASVASATPPVVVAPTPPPDERAVRLAVEPADAKAEVDGRATPVNEGGIELHGVIGSVHHVRLFKGSQETIAEVAITRLGAVLPQDAGRDDRAKAPRQIPRRQGGRGARGAVCELAGVQAHRARARREVRIALAAAGSGRT